MPSIDGSYVAIRVSRAATAPRRSGACGSDGLHRLQRHLSAQRRGVARLRRADRRSAARRGREYDLLRYARSSARTPTASARARAIETLLDEPVALKRIGVLGYGATARAILAELHDNDAYTFVWGRDAQRVATRPAGASKRNRGRTPIRPRSCSARFRPTPRCRESLVGAAAAPPTS